MEERDHITFDDHELLMQDQRKLYAGPYNLPCPTCGEANAITAEMKRRGHHCDRCTIEVEQGYV